MWLCYRDAARQIALLSDHQRHSAKSMHSSEICWLWDIFKATMNQQKHKVSFQLAAVALNDPDQLSQLDTDSYEHRFKTLARVEDVILLIVHTEPEREQYSGNLVGRIISARIAKPAERRAYFNG